MPTVRNTRITWLTFQLSANDFREHPDQERADDIDRQRAQGNSMPTRPAPIATR